MKKICVIIIALIILTAGCSGVDEKKSDKIRVATTVGMITDIVKNIGGDKVEVQGLMGPGVDPHLYKASEGDVRTLANADIIFYGGIHLEGKMVEVLEEMQSRTRTVAVTDYIPREQLLDFPGYPGQYDPHVWFDVKMWIKSSERVRDELIDYDPANKEYYTKNAEEYIAKLEKLDDYVKQKAQEIPKEQRVLVTAHDAFQYFGRAYGFEVKGLQGISTVAEAGTGDVQNLVDFIVKRKIKAIFVESSVPERNIKAVQEAARSKGWDVQVGGSLYSDAMGDEGTFDGTYVGMVTHNIDTMNKALK